MDHFQVIVILIVSFIYLARAGMKAEDNYRCTNCGSSGPYDIVMKIDENSNYMLPPSSNGSMSTLTRYKCRNCGYIHDVISEEPAA